MNKALSKTIGIILVFALIHSILPMAAFAESTTVSVTPTTCTNDNIEVSWSDFPEGSGIVRYEWSVTSSSEGFGGNDINNTETSGSSSLDLPEGEKYVWLRAVYSGEEYGEGIRSQTQYNRDITDPSINIESPSTSDVVNGTVTITGSVSDDNLDSWVLEYGAGADPSSWSQISTGNDPVDDTLGNWDTSSLAGTYTLRLSADDLAGYSPDPVTIQVTIDSPPSVPTDLTCTSVTGSEATLLWTASSDDVGVTSYIVYRDGTEAGTATGTTYTDTALSDITTYTYTVAAEDTAGNQSDPSEAVQVMTLDATAPDTPAELTCDSMTGTSISLSWEASDDNVAVTEYDVYRDGTKVGSSPDTSFTDTGLSDNTIYGYTVEAKDAEGNVSDESKTVYAALSTDMFAYSNNENMLTITWYGGTDTVVHIPAMIGGNAVTSVGDWAFFDCAITQVTIPDTVTSIGTEVFAGCGDLSNITIPGSVINIGEGAFGSCSSLEEVIIEDGVASIGNTAFYECSHLMSIMIPGSVSSIGNSAFECCHSLESVMIEDGMTSIGDWAFSDCGSLEDITIPDSVASIGDGAFYECCSLASITVPSDVMSIGDSTFEGCGSLENIVLPDSVTSIGNWAFSGCSCFTEITLPDGLTSIGDGAFYDCSSLIGITIPGSVTNISNDTFQNCYGLENVTIEKGVANIGDGAFYECSSLTGITIPGSVTDIGNNAFESCENLADVSFSDGLTDVGEWSFAGCGFTDITIPDSVTSIGDRAFAYCYSLETAVIPSTIIYEATVFEECPNLTITILDRTPPAAPTDLSCTAVTRDAVTIEWTAATDNVGVTGYIVYRDGVEIGAASDTTYTDTGRSDTTTYTYTISAEDAEGNESDLSESLEVTTLDGTVPTAPTDLTCTSVTGSAATLTWTASTDNVGVTGYIIYRDGTEVGDTSETTYTDTGLTDAATYAYTVIAEDGEGNQSNPSEPLEVTTLDTTAPTAPTDLAYTSLTDYTVSLTWSASADTIGVTEYDIYRDGTKVGTTEDTVYTDSGLSGNTTYVYTVKAKDEAGNESDASNAVSATTIAVQFTYSVNADDTVTITGYNGMAAIVNIPAVIAGHTVTAIGDSAFKNRSDITAITILDSVTSIGEGAFAGCAFTHITLPDGITSIEPYTFYQCGNLAGIEIPEGVTSIGYGAFSNCGSLTSVSIPDSVTTIAEWAFYECGSLESVVIPDGITSIDYVTFYHCGSLTSITIPDSVTSIGDWAFIGCGLTELTIPNSVTSIGDYAFYDCGDITSVVIPDSVTSIGAYAFNKCGITSITVPGSVMVIGDAAFANCNALTSVSMQEGVSGIGDYLFAYCHSLSDITFSDSVTSVGKGAFSGCGVTDITIPDGVTSIGDYAFAYCSSLMNATVPSTLPIGSTVFEGCPNVTITVIDLTPPSAPTDLSCTSLSGTEATLAWTASTDNVGVTGYRVYRDGVEVGTTSDTTYTDTGLDEVTTYTYTVIAEDAEGNQSDPSEALEVITLDVTVPSVPTDLTCTLVTDAAITLAWTASTDNVWVSEYDIYRDGIKVGSSSDTSYTDSGLSVDTAYTYTVIAEDAAGNISEVSNETIATTSIYYYSINSDGALTTTGYGGTDQDVIIPDMITGKSVTTIGDRAFYGRSDIVRVRIPVSVTSVGEYAFAGCSSLTSAIVPSTLYVGPTVFEGCPNLTITIVDQNSPLAPINLTCTSVTGTAISLSWTASADNMGVTGYIIYRDGTEAGNISTTAYADTYTYTDTDTGLADGRLYVYTVTAIDAQGNESDESEPLEVSTPDITAPIAPSDLTWTSMDKNSISIKWTAAEDNVGVTEYDIYRNSSKIATTSETSYVSAGLSSGSTYTYKIKAKDAAGNTSGYSNSFSLKTSTISYVENPDGTISVVDYTGTTTSLTIPSTYGGKTVTGIANWALESCTFSSIALPSSIKSIGDYAFYNCAKLTKITIPDSVTSIGEHAFEGCSKLASATTTVSSSLISIGAYAFANCIVLANITISNTVISIGEHAFEGCNKLASATLSSSLTSLGAYAFNNCIVLANITIPNSVTSIGAHAFEGCSKLASVTLSSGLTSIGPYAFTNCIVLANITIPDTVTTIGEGAFESCGITSITLPDGLGDIEEYTFYNCANLASIIIPDSVTRIGWNAFKDCSSLTSITLPDSVTSIDSSAFRECSSLASITIPDSVTSISDAAFEECTSLTSVTIPDSVTIIGNSAFGECTSLTSITIPDSVISISSSAFRECTSLTSITIPDSVTIIGNSAFRECTSLTSITIPDSVTIIGDSAFEECTSLTSITIPDSVTRIGWDFFKDCTSLTSITIPDSVTSICGSAFEECISLTSITISDGVTSIGYSAFFDCTSLASITIPDSVTSIGKYAFNSCTSLASITIPDSVTSIGYSAFCDCTSLASITIPDSVTSIGKYAFKDCTSLTSITIPDSVTSIGQSAFYHCRSLRSIAIPNTVTIVGTYAFANCTNLRDAIVSATTTIDQTVFSESFILTITVDSSYPEAPEHLKAKRITDDSITIEWEASSDDTGVIGYKIYRDGVYLDDIAQTNYTDTGLERNLIYTYTIKAYDAVRNLSEESEPVRVIISDPLISALTVYDTDHTDNWAVMDNLQQGELLYGDASYTVTYLPSAFSGMQWIQTAYASKAYSGATLASFTAVEDIQVYIGLGMAAESIPEWMNDWTATGGIVERSDSKTYAMYRKDYSSGTVVNLGPAVSTGDMYTIMILPGSFTDTEAPKVPSSVGCGIADTSVALHWEASSDNIGTLTYDVYRDGIKIGEAAEPRYADTALTPDTPYTYTIRARDLAGNVSEASEQLIAHTLLEGQSLFLLDGLIVYDTDNSGYWSLETNLKAGDICYFGEDDAFTQIPEYLYGSEWVKPYEPSKSFVADVLFSVHLTMDAEMYILYDADAATMPGWMNGWIKTGDTALVDEDQFNVYRKRFEGGSTAEFGSGDSNNAMYIVAARACMTATEDLTLTLSEDMIVPYNLYLDGGTIDLNGYKLTVKGDLVQSDGTLNIGTGQLQVNGDYRIQTEGAAANGTVEYSESDGTLSMDNPSGTMTVGGSFIIDYSTSLGDTTKLVLKGDVEIGKDLYFYTDDTSPMNDEFTTRSTTVDLEVHKRLHCGGNARILADNVLFTDDEDSQEGDRLNVDIEGDLYVDIYEGDVHNRYGIKFCGGTNVQIGGDTRISGDLRVDDNANLTFKKGFYFQEAVYANDKWTYSPTNGVLKIAGDPYILVEGDFVFQSNYASSNSDIIIADHLNQIISGTIAIMGNFTQKKGATTASAANFNPVVVDSEHPDPPEQAFVLCGEKKQKVHFDNPKNSKFNVLKISKPLKSGYSFSSKSVWHSLIVLYRGEVQNGQQGVYAPNGNYCATRQDLVAKGPYFNTAITRAYNSNNAAEKGVMGYGWVFGYEGRVTHHNGLPTTYKVALPDGSKYVFTLKEDHYESEDTRSTFQKQEDGYLLTTPSQYKYYFNLNGFLIYIEEPAGNRIRFSVNDQGRIERITDEVGRQYHISYNEDGYIASISDPINRVVSYTYENGHLAEVTDCAGYKQYYQYDDKGTLSAVEDNGHNVLESLVYTYDKKGKNPKIKTHTDQYGNVFKYAYSTSKMQTTITDSNSRVKTVTYDGAYAKQTEKDYEGRTTSVVFHKTDSDTGANLYGEIKSQTGRNGNVTKYERDDRGNVTKVTNPDNSYKVYQYDERNNVVYAEDENRNKTYYEYYTNTNLVSRIIRPINGTDTYVQGGGTEGFVVTGYEYYTAGECESLFGCNVTALLKAEIDGEGNRTTYTYDQYGNIESTTYPQGNTVDAEYDDIGRITSETSGEGFRTEYEYDVNGNLIRTILDGEETILNEYDYAGRLTKSVSAVLYETGDYAGDHGYRYTYSPSGLLLQQVDPEGYTTTYTYDIYGNKATETLPNGVVYLYTYDKMNRVTHISFKDNAEGASIVLRKMVYAILLDKTLQVTQTDYVDDETSLVTTYIYDYANRLLRTTQPDQTVLTPDYNDNGTVASTTDAAGHTTYYDYDGLGHVVGQWSPFGNADGSMTYSYTSFVYDKADNLVRQREYLAPLAHGTVSGPYIETVNTYDGNGNLLAAEDSDGHRTEYQYDQDDAVSQKKVLVSPGVYQIESYENNYFGKPDQMVQKVRAGDLVGHNFNDDTIIDLTIGYDYDANGNLIIETRPDDVIIAYTYDLLDRPTGISQPVTDEYGDTVTATMSTTYDYAGNILTQTDRNGNTTQNVYDKRGFLIKTIDPMGGVNAFEYDRLGRVKREVTPANYIDGAALEGMNRKEYTYDKMGRIVTESFSHEDETGWVSYVSKAFKYDANGNKTKELDALGYASVTGTEAQRIANGYGTLYTYDCAGNMLTMLDPVSKDRGLAYTKRYVYDGRGRKISETNADGSHVNFEYDSMDHVTKTVYADGTGTTLSETNYAYDLAGNPASVTDANGNTTQYRFNALGKAAREIQPGDDTIGQNTITCQYDTLGNLVKQSDTFGTVTQYTYDELGRDTSKAVRDGGNTDPIEVEVRYDLNGNPRFTVDGNGSTVEKTYDANNRLLTEGIEVGGVLQTNTYTYDANGNQLTATDWLGNTTRAVYDPLNRIIKKYDAADNRVEKLTYNNNDQQTITQDARGNRTYFAYDRNNRLADTTDEEQHTQSQGYDDTGNISVKTDAKGNETQYGYDGMNRLVKVTNALGQKTVFTYDGAGNRLTMKDGRGNITTYAYNVRNLVSAEIEPGGIVDGEYVDGLVTRYTYYCNSLLETTEDKSGTITANTYDVHGRKLSQVSGAVSISYSYDDNGNLLTMTDGTGATTRTYDERNRVLTKQVPVIGTATYVYDLTQGLTGGHHNERSTDPKGNVVVKEYDKAGRLSAVINEGETTAYEYYPNGSRQRVVYADGACEEYTYYPDNQVHTLTNKKSDGTIITNYNYTYDEQNNQTSKTDGMGVTAYGYDALNRIATTTGPAGAITSWSYDKAGNRARQIVKNGTQFTVDAYTYDTQNRLTMVTQAVNGILVKETEYTSDDTGNQTQVDITPYVDGHVDAPIQEVYTYDELNRLTGVETPDTEAEYTYNGDGLRVAKTIGENTENYLYEGSRVVLETDGDNDEIAVNVYGLNLVQRETGGVKARYMYNGHADVTALLGENDELLASYYYDAFGNVTMKTGEYDNPYRYSGYRYDEETKNYYLTARYYNPLIARFLQEDTYRGDPNDPLSLNLYTYCVNNPLVYVDPSGHRPLSTMNIWEETKEDRKISTNHMKTTSRRAAERTAEITKAKQEFDMDAELRREKRERIRGWGKNGKPKKPKTPEKPSTSTKKDTPPPAEPAPAPTLTSAFAPTASIAAATVYRAPSYIPTEVRDFSRGVLTSGINNMALGIPQLVNQATGNKIHKPNSTAYQIGKVVGDVIGFALGAYLTTQGATMAVGGVLCDATGVGAVLGIPLNVVGAIEASYGGGVVVASSLNLINDVKYLQASAGNGGGSGRAKNKLQPDSEAQGPHSTFKRDPNTGEITNYKTWEPNSKNPNGFDPVKGYDGTGKPHTNSVTKQDLMPHIHDKTVPGGVRVPELWEIPSKK